MTAFEWPGFAIAVVLAGGLGLVLRSTRPFAVVGTILWMGIFARIVGSLLRYHVHANVYGGAGDASGYFGWGKFYAERLWSFDLSIFDSTHWFLERWWGTQAIRYFSGFVLSVIGPSYRGGFLVFALFSFIGVVLIARAVFRAYPHVSPRPYLLWVFLFPSLWYWPSSMGKEALVLLALGLVTAGYVGDGVRTNWLKLGAGVAGALAIRPHLASVVAGALLCAICLVPSRKWTVHGVVGVTALAALVVSIVSMSMTQIGIESADVETVQEYVERRRAMTSGGGSGMDLASEQSTASIPMAFVNVLFRPFPFEAHNVLALFSSAELWLLWGLAWLRRDVVWHNVKHWRQDRLLRFLVPLLVLYILMIGLSFQNLGLIARQRVLIFPFLFVLAMVPVRHALRAPAGVRLPLFGDMASVSRAVR